MDLLVGDTKNYEHCVDDSLLWDNNTEDNFFRVCEFIEKCPKAGCIFNPQKFQFAQETVDFLGFRITPNGMKPHPDFLRTIQENPTPKNITDMRSWFVLIGQVSYAFAATLTTPWNTAFTRAKFLC